MKKTFLALGICTAVTAFAQQNQPDSIHIVLHENQNGNMRVLDTIVPITQQQQLFIWMQSNGWEAPPPPTPGQHGMFEHEIVIEGDSTHGSGQRMVFVTMEGDSITDGQPKMMMIRTNGAPGEMPPPPPGCQMRVIHEDGSAGENGDVVIMRHPMPPPVPGSDVNVNIETKDTIIDGKTRKMIIKTERIILPEGAAVPPAPPVPPKAPMPPTPPSNDKSSVPDAGNADLLVYPNPTTSIINVEFDLGAKDKTTLRVIDMNGKVVYSEEMVDEHGKHVKREINLSGKGKGTYTVEVTSTKKKIIEKVVVQ